MIILDSDHISIFQRGTSPNAVRLRTRMWAESRQCCASIVSLEEQMKGWLAAINRQRDVRLQVDAYARLQNMFSVFSHWVILPWTDEAAELFVQLRQTKIRVPTMDLKIACIAITNDALLLTRNTVDFEKVPRLKFEDWLA